MDWFVPFIAERAKYKRKSIQLIVVELHFQMAKLCIFSWDLGVFNKSHLCQLFHFHLVYFEIHLMLSFQA